MIRPMFTPYLPVHEHTGTPHNTARSRTQTTLTTNSYPSLFNPYHFWRLFPLPLPRKEQILNRKEGPHLHSCTGLAENDFLKIHLHLRTYPDPGESLSNLTKSDEQQVSLLYPKDKIEKVVEKHLNRY